MGETLLLQKDATRNAWAYTDPQSPGERGTAGMTATKALATATEDRGMAFSLLIWAAGWARDSHRPDSLRRGIDIGAVELREVSKI